MFFPANLLLSNTRDVQISPLDVLEYISQGFMRSCWPRHRITREMHICKGSNTAECWVFLAIQPREMCWYTSGLSQMFVEALPNTMCGS